MKKIPTLFVRNPDDRRFVLDEVTIGCEWVIDNEGLPTRKYDGTCVMFDGIDWWARREVKPGKPQPKDFVEVDTDEVTGKTVGWVPIAQSSFVAFWAEAIARRGNFLPGTYELVGPKINGNPEQVDQHQLVPHDSAEVVPVPDVLTFATLADEMSYLPFEGIVWHHPDGRMCKLKRRDFPKA